MTLTTADHGGIPAFLDRRPFVGTYTNLNALRSVCEHQFYRRYVKRDQAYVETPAMRWGNEVHAAFESRLGRARRPLPDAMRAWERFAAPFDKFDALVEEKLAMTDRGCTTGYWDADAWFRGKVDAVVLNLEKKTAFIADWKTGGSRYEDPFELATNALLIKARWPEVARVVGSYCWLKEERMSEQYDLSDFRATFLEVRRLMALVAEKRASGEWEKRKSGLCGYCSVKDCENWYEARQ